MDSLKKEKTPKNPTEFTVGVLPAATTISVPHLTDKMQWYAPPLTPVFYLTIPLLLTQKGVECE